MKHGCMRIAALLLLLCVFVSTAAAVPAGYEFPEDWSREALVFAVENGVLQGDQNGNLNPQANITRAEMAAILVRLLGAHGKADLRAFTDVPATAWYYDELSAAVDAGIFTGISRTRMEPDAPLTREQAVTVICRAFGIVSLRSGAAFCDDAQISGYARMHVASLSALGYLTGYPDGSFRPLHSISRAEVAQLIFRLFDVIADTPEEIPDSGSVLYRGAAPLPEMLRHTGNLYIGCALTEPLALTDWEIRGALCLRTPGENALSLDGLTADPQTCAMHDRDVSGGAVSTLCLWGDQLRYTGAAASLVSIGGAHAASGTFDTVQLWTGALTLEGEAEKLTLGRGTTLVLNGTAQEILLPYRDSTVTGSGYAERILAYEKNARVHVRYGSFVDYYQTEHDSALRVVKTMRVPCKVLYNTSLYTDRYLTTAICEVSAGTVVYNEWHPDNYAIQVSLPNGIKGFLPDWACQVDATCVTTDGTLDYSDAVKEGFVELRDYDSKTDYLIWISRYTQKVIVYQGSKGNWTVIRTMDCSSGCNNTITPAGIYEIYYRTARWHFGDYYVDMVSGFNGGHAFHTVTYKPDGGYLDSRLGEPRSQGCIRLMPENAAYIYGLPVGTRVVVY